MPSSKPHPAMSDKARDILDEHLEAEDAPHMSEHAIEVLTRLLAGEAPEHPEHPEHSEHSEYPHDSHDAPRMSERAKESLYEHQPSVLEKFGIEIELTGLTAIDSSSA